MKFIGGTQHGRDVPIPLQVAIYSQRRQWVQIDDLLAGQASGPERYRVVSWPLPDGGEAKLLAREGLSRQAIEAFARQGSALSD
jgi:hypothetical protein